MKVSLDECVPWSLNRLPVGHECKTAQQCGWGGIKNGDLLGKAEAQFEAFVTADQDIRYQQNPTGRRLSLVVLGSNIWPLVSRHAASIGAAVAGATPGSYEFIDVPLPPRPRRERDS